MSYRDDSIAKLKATCAMSQETFILDSSFEGTTVTFCLLLSFQDLKKTILGIKYRKNAIADKNFTYT